jgi:ABC-2 type transport system ATP-binding protein
VGAGVPVREFRPLLPDLEDVFVELTGEGFDVSG